MSISRQLHQVHDKKYLSYELVNSLAGSATITSDLIDRTNAELSAGADPNEKFNDDNYTLLSLVTRKHSIDINLKESLIELLLSYNANPNIRHQENQQTFFIYDTRSSSLTIASDQKSWSTVITLVTKTMIPHHQDLLGYALLCALYHNTDTSIQTAKILLKAGANPNIKGLCYINDHLFYFYPLHLEGAYHDQDITDLLLQKGVDVTLTNSYGKTPLRLLVKFQNQDARFAHCLSIFKKSVTKIQNFHKNRLGIIVFQRYLLRTEKTNKQQKISRTLQLLLKIPGDIHLHIESFLLPTKLLRKTDPHRTIYIETTKYEADTHQKKMAVFKKIYTALYNGQSRLFKYAYQWDKKNLSRQALSNEIKRYTENNPFSITAKTSALVIEYQAIDPSQPIPLELFLKIYQSSFESSGLLFKKSKLLGEKNPFYRSSSLNTAITKKQPASQEIFDHAQKFTFFGYRNRTFNILKALDMIDDQGNKKNDFARLEN